MSPLVTSKLGRSLSNDGLERSNEVARLSYDGRAGADVAAENLLSSLPIALAFPGIVDVRASDGG